jgi:very-short-patch-repair endonuclease
MIRSNQRSLVDVTTPHKSRSWDGIRRHHKALPADEVTVHAGIPVTTVPRTIFDLAATEDVDTVGSMLRESEHRNLWDRLSLPDLVERYPGRRGVKKVRLALARIIEEPSGRKHSKLEERFAPFLRRDRLPMPRFNDWILLGAERYQVDCHWPGAGQIIELDGWEGHGTKSAFRDDRERDRRLRVAGYSVTRLTWNQLDDEAEAIAADLRALLGVNAFGYLRGLGAIRSSCAKSSSLGSQRTASAFSRTCSGFVAPAITEATAGCAARPPIATSIIAIPRSSA